MPFTPLDPSLAAAAPVTGLGAPAVGGDETLESMRNWLRLSLGNRDDIDEGTLNTWINDAYIDVATSTKLDALQGSFLITTVAGQPFYTLPSAVYTVLSISLKNSQLYLTGGYSLGKIDKSNKRELED